MNQILVQYYNNNARELRKLVDGILAKFSGWSNKDVDDFYSLANEVFVDVMRKYDNSQSFEVFLYCCLSNRIKTEMTRRIGKSVRQIYCRYRLICRSGVRKVLRLPM